LRAPIEQSLAASENIAADPMDELRGLVLDFLIEFQEVKRN
jgi:hypothetical protein